MQTLKAHLKLLLVFVRVCVQDTAAYRFDFVAHILIALAHLGGELMAVWIIFSNTQSIGGWNACEILVLLGIYRIMQGTITLFIAPNMRALMEDIRTGTLDYVILKPVSSQFYASFRKVVVWRLTDVFFGAVLATFACWRLSAVLSPARLLSFVILLSAGVAIIYSFWLILGTLAFWFTRITNIEMVFWNVFEAGRYPVDIYRPWIRWSLTYVVPLAFLITFPAASLTGKASSAGALTAIILAIIALIGSSLFWRYGIRHYSGASA